MIFVVRNELEVQHFPPIFGAKPVPRGPIRVFCSRGDVDARPSERESNNSSTRFPKAFNAYSEVGPRIVKVWCPGCKIVALQTRGCTPNVDPGIICMGAIVMQTQFFHR